ncbi:MAG TPA: hypothetical protein VKU19_20955 [Bryobacteraceae bacterium]|nr:hypothetical protein [Bryobacteraceae bacterium]
MSKLRRRSRASAEPGLRRAPGSRPSAEDTPATEPPNPWRSLGIFAALLVCALVLWKLVLLTPLLDFSRTVIQVCFRALPFPESQTQQLITVDNGNGDWVVHASYLHLAERDITKQIAGEHEAGVRTQPVMLQVFSLSLPFFWALSLAVWPGKQAARILGLGTLLQLLISQIAMIFFLAYWTDRYFVVASALWSEFLLQLTGYCALNVVPYAAPLITVIWLHQRLRVWVFGALQRQIPPAPQA